MPAKRVAELVRSARVFVSTVPDAGQIDIFEDQGGPIGGGFNKAAAKISTSRGEPTILRVRKGANHDMSGPVSASPAERRPQRPPAGCVESAGTSSG